MSEHDITAGGRRRIVSEDQAANLREQAELLAEFERYLAMHGRTTCHLDAASRLEDEGALWDELGEESQDPGWT